MEILRDVEAIVVRERRGGPLLVGAARSERVVLERGTRVVEREEMPDLGGAVVTLTVEDGNQKGKDVMVRRGQLSLGVLIRGPAIVARGRRSRFVW